jgi:hypothetical protein
LVHSGKQFILKNYQEIGHILMNPHTKHRRLLCNIDTGAGKTIFALSLAHNFARMYHHHWLTERVVDGNVVVLGFTNDIFQDELINWLNFGFVNADELRQLNRLREQSAHGQSIQEYINYRSMLKKRLSNRNYGGFYAFFGYKKLFNVLFLYNESARIEITSLLGISDVEDGINDRADQIYQHIKDGRLRINPDVAKLFEGKRSILICDEFHELYNSQEKNTYGLTVKIIMMLYPETRLVALTATPINNVAIEIIDALSYLEDGDHAPRLKDVFVAHRGSDAADQRDVTCTIAKTADAAMNFCIGKVFTYRNIDTKNYPSIIEHGEYIEPKKLLKFMICEPSKEYSADMKKRSAVIDHADATADDSAVDDEEHADNDPIYVDLVYPGPYYSTRDALEAYRDEHDGHDDYVKVVDAPVVGQQLVGEYLEYHNLGKHSPKYKKMLDIIYDILRGTATTTGKIFIYHSRLNDGIYMIRNVLLANGFMEEGQIPHNGSICSRCGKTYEKHSAEGRNADHDFNGAYILLYHGSLSKQDKLITKNKWNSVENIWGRNFIILLGTNAIQQSVTLLDTQHTIIARKPRNISKIKQIFGRSRRNMSHARLPPRARFVNYYILAISGSQEEQFYISKLKEFSNHLAIQQLLLKKSINVYYNENQLLDSSGSHQSLLEPAIGPVRDFFAHHHFKSRPSYASYQYYHMINEVNICKRVLITYLGAAAQLAWTHDELSAALTSDQLNDVIDIPYNMAKANKDCINVAIYDTLHRPGNSSSPIIIRSSHRNSGGGSSGSSQAYKLVPMKSGNQVYYTVIAWANGKLDFAGRGQSQSTSSTIIQSINIASFIRKEEEVSYYELKKKVFAKYSLIGTSSGNKVDTVSNINEIITHYSEDFFISLIRDTIIYIFNVWTNPLTTTTEFHEQYIKFIIYLDSLNVIVYASDNPELSYLYAPYIHSGVHYDLALGKAVSSSGSSKTKGDSLSVLQQLIQSSSIKSRYDINKYYQKVNMILSSHISESTSRSEKGKSVTVKAYANLLPVGYYFRQDTYYYKPPGAVLDKPQSARSKANSDASNADASNAEHGSWFINNYKLDLPHFKENDIIIGYYEATDYVFRFQLRSPIHLMQKHSDNRKNERGYTCINKPKHFIKSLCVKLGINSPSNNKRVLCKLIEHTLIENEYHARVGNSNIKWVYHYFEHQPQLH